MHVRLGIAQTLAKYILLRSWICTSCKKYAQYCPSLILVDSTVEEKMAEPTSAFVTLSFINYNALSKYSPFRQTPENVLNFCSS